MRFHLDENISWRVAVRAQRLGLDVTSTREAGLNGASDEQQLRHAGQNGRCLVSRDYDDYLRATELLVREQAPHAGVLLIAPQLRLARPARAASALSAYAEQHPDCLESYSIHWLIA